MNVVRFSAIRTGRLDPTENIPGTHFCSRLSRAQGHRIMSIRNSNDSIWNRTRNLQACSACATVLFSYVWADFASWRREQSQLTRHSLHRMINIFCIMFCHVCTPFIWMQRTLRKNGVVVSLHAENCWHTSEYNLLLYELRLSASVNKRSFYTIYSFDTILCAFGKQSVTWGVCSASHCIWTVRMFCLRNWVINCQFCANLIWNFNPLPTNVVCIWSS
jgi:hypothetical protein